MEPKTKERITESAKKTKEQYHYTYKLKDGKKVKFYGDEAILNDFDIHHYGDSGTLYFRKRD